MTVAQLIKCLQSENPKAQVVLQKDSEGNGYSPLSGADAAYYVLGSAWSGTVYAKKWSASDCCMEDDEHAKMVKDKSAQCVVLYPIN